MTQRDDRYATFVERAGLFMEGQGLPRIAGRIFGLLLVSPHELALDEITERLGVSRASVSIDARRLEQMGIVERVGRPGDRKDYYRIAPDHHIRALEQRIASVREFLVLLRDARGLPDAPPDVEERLEAAGSACEDIVQTMAAGLERWRQRAETERRARALFA